jgi:hypothetical protein
MPNIPITQEQVAGLIRHIVTVIGTLFMARGWAVGGYLDIVAGALATIGGAIWSFMAKLQATPAASDPQAAPKQPPTATLLMGTWQEADPYWSLAQQLNRKRRMGEQRYAASAADLWPIDGGELKAEDVPDVQPLMLPAPELTDG